MVRTLAGMLWGGLFTSGMTGVILICLECVVNIPLERFIYICIFGLGISFLIGATWGGILANFSSLSSIIKMLKTFFGMPVGGSAGLAVGILGVCVIRAIMDYRFASLYGLYPSLSILVLGNSVFIGAVLGGYQAGKDFSGS